MKEIYELTEHAKDVIKERNIPIEYMERTLFEPKLKYRDEIQNELEHRLKPIEENENRVLRVVVNIISIPIKIVTLFFDRRIKGKL